MVDRLENELVGVMVVMRVFLRVGHSVALSADARVEELVSSSAGWRVVL